jgi:hypothetical protein
VHDRQKTGKEKYQASSSAFYLGPQCEHLLDFTINDHDIERFNRLTNENSRYYSYLYTALYEKELIQQWKNGGIDISNRPEIIATLFNIGFENSNPHPNPMTGGADIEINGREYSFGGLADDFYQSNELPEFSK